MNTFRINLNRSTFFIIGAIILGLILIFKLFYLSVYRNSEFLNKIILRKESSSVLKRGNIYIDDISGQSRKIVATNRTVYQININKDKFSDYGTLYNALGSEFSPEELEKIKNDIENQDKEYTISNNVSKSLYDRVSKLNLDGLKFSYKNERFYPYGALAANVIGFLGFKGYDRVGQYGVEAYYDDILSGGDGRNILKNFLDYKTASESDNQNINRIETIGDINLTIDINIQNFIEKTATRLMRRWLPDKVTIIVQDPNTGAILGMVSSPSFNPNNYKDFSLSSYLNDSIQSVYEPGSSFKPVTIAGAFDTKSVTTKTTYLDTGEYVVDGFKIKNYDEKSHGRVDMAQVLQKSLNTGTIFAKNRMGDDSFLNYVVRFGFGDRTGIDMAGEVAGNIANLYTNRKSNFATATFGQGISVTPLQLINAYSAIANGGHLLRPYVVSSIKYPDGKTYNMKSKVIADVILPSTSKILSDMLVSVVDYGFDHARIKGYDIAGKTGTAQIASPTGGYLPDGQFIHNFVGYAPASDPKFTVLIKMDKPEGITFAADSLSSYFADISGFLIQYLHIKPTR